MAALGFAGISPLSELDEVAWSRLKHAFGSAADVPDRIRALVSEDASEREEAMTELLQSIHHQASIYSASAAALPFLLGLLADPAPPGREQLALLVAAIAEGVGAEADVLAIQRALLLAEALIVSLTADSAVAPFALKMLARLPELGEAAVARLGELARDPSELTRAGACLALVKAGGERAAATLAAAQEDASGLVRQALAIAWLEQASGERLAWCVAELLAVACGPGDVDDAWQALTDQQDATSAALEALGELAGREAVLVAAVSARLQAHLETATRAVNEVAATIIRLAFLRRATALTNADLSAEQHAFLTWLVALEPFWQRVLKRIRTFGGKSDFKLMIDGALALALRRSGLPKSRELLAELLLPPGKPALRKA